MTQQNELYRKHLLEAKKHLLEADKHEAPDSKLLHTQLAMSHVLECLTIMEKVTDLIR
jgi:hypothetical protein